MGLAVDRESFEESEFELFSERLARCLTALQQLLARPGFGVGASSLGAELEFSLVDAAGRPLPLNRKVLADTFDPRVTVELDRFNLECNLRHTGLAGRPFSHLATEFEDTLTEVKRAAGLHGGRLAVIGILPTLVAEDLQSGAMTDLPRYRALSRALQRLRSAPFRVNIDGDDPLDIRCDDVTFEGANTSLQVHLRVDPGDFARVYNAVQLATAPVLAASCNSPTFLGHRLWEETRVALFKQAVDPRRSARRTDESRVSFGTGWVRDGAYELFAENINLHEPLIPILGPEDPLVAVGSEGVPRLDEMRLHQGTVWRWNRAIYDPAEGGHLRIEMRALPAGPTIVDMLANMAFLVGLSWGLADDSESWIRTVSFEAAERNFYRAAQGGLAAEFVWPSSAGRSPLTVHAGELARRLLPVARAGLDAAGVAADESERLLGIIEERLAVGQTGAVWQRRTLAALEPSLGRQGALAAMLERYLAHSAGGQPVHRWPLEA